MSAVGVTYSFKDLVGVLTNPVFGVSIQLAGGNIGVGSITIAMVTEHTVHDIASDGVVMPSYVAGDNGAVTLEVQQTAPMHHELLALYNLCLIAANNDDLSGWNASVISFRTVLDSSTHVLNGVSFGKIPDKPYQATGQRVHWNLMAANVVNS